jgi:hypothetical protein
MKQLLLLCCLCLATGPALNAENSVAQFAKSPAVLAACGPQSIKGNPRTIPIPKVESGPSPGNALVYFFSNPAQAFAPGIVRIGIDGKWVGAVQGDSFVAVGITPGQHHVCSNLLQKYSGNEIALDNLRARAGQTYFFTTLILNDLHGGTKYLLYPTDPAEAALLLQRARDDAAIIAARWPKYNLLGHRRMVPTTTLESVQQAVKKHPAIDACGPYTTRFTVTLNPTHAMLGRPSPGHALVYFLFDPKAQVALQPAPVVNVGLDGSWSGALKHKSYLPVEIMPGKHVACFEHISSADRYGYYGHFVQLRGLDAQAGKTYYFHVLLLASYNDYGAKPNAFVVDPVDSAEGSLFVETSALSVPVQKQKRK